MIGIEPDGDPVSVGHKEFTLLYLYEGDHETMASGELPLPDRISVLLMSYVCLLLRPETMEAIVQFAGRRCERVVILDDLSNTNVEFVVTR